MNQNPDVHVINKLIFKKQPKVPFLLHNLSSCWILAYVTTDHLEKNPDLSAYYFQTAQPMGGFQAKIRNT